MMNFDDILFEVPDDLEQPLCCVQQLFDEIRNEISLVFSSGKPILLAGAFMLSFIPLNTSAESVIIDENLPSLQINIEEQRTEKVTLSIFSQSETQERLERNLRQIENLQIGWDGYCADVPSREAIEHASLLIQELDDVTLKESAFFPSNDGGIYLQGRLPKGKYTLFLNGKTMTYVVKNKESRMSATVDVTRFNVSYLNEGLKHYV